MDDQHPEAARLCELVSSQKLGVLATQGESGPYGSLVAFAATSDCRAIVFATARATRKFANLARSGSAALVVDNRSNQVEDFHRASAATLMGTARELTGAEKEQMAVHYLAKHPHLRQFLHAPTCALFRLDVETCYVVNRFQTVMELEVRQ